MYHTPLDLKSLKHPNFKPMWCTEGQRNVDSMEEPMAKEDYLSTPKICLF